ncbi:hypothetical protein [Clostridium sp. JN-1]|uniref:hypothetical protein n=1 Tax=Clostridium sp. JN-1 TaxID=2483110 RepID=UPI000F0B24B0|nr:hypothetical protein [Clostridium sp. JN-1]
MNNKHDGHSIEYSADNQKYYHWEASDNNCNDCNQEEYCKDEHVFRHKCCPKFIPGPQGPQGSQGPQGGLQE